MALLCNLDVESSLVNGSRGVIVRFIIHNNKSYPVVQFIEREKETVIEEHVKFVFVVDLELCR